MGDEPLYIHADTLAIMDEDIPLSNKLEYLHQLIAKRYAFIERLAVAVYDPKTDSLKTFIHSSGDANPLAHYQARLSETSSLRAIIDNASPRVVNDLGIFENNDKLHSQKINQQGYRASYTLPMFRHGNFFGFIFFNAKQPNVFTPEVLHDLDLFGHLLSLTVTGELEKFRTLEAAIQTARDITHHRDAETGGHLDRMSRYARLIAEELAERYGFSDEYIEQIFLFSPLHDIGKIAIPDDILLKPGKLSEEEFRVMQSHTEKGREIIQDMLDHFCMSNARYREMLGNIAQYHHEALNGMGYPRGLQGEEIPIEARIISVADIFDALTSKRPYKEAWSNERAFAMLQTMSGLSLDPDCVDAMINNRERIEEIQARFTEDAFG